MVSTRARGAEGALGESTEVVGLQALGASRRYQVDRERAGAGAAAPLVQIPIESANHRFRRCHSLPRAIVRELPLDSCGRRALITGLVTVHAGTRKTCCRAACGTSMQTKNSIG